MHYNNLNLKINTGKNMKAFLIAYVTVKNGEKFQSYAQAAGKSMQPFGGQVLTKGQAVKALAGEHNQQNVAIISFPTIENLESWYNSLAYQAIIPLRNEAADITLTSYVIPE